MSEVKEHRKINESPLSDLHAYLGVQWLQRAGWLVPASYGDVLREYAAVREHGAGLIDLSSRGRILVTGTEAVQFLNGLVTNDIKTLKENHWIPAVFPNVQGRLIASVRIIRWKDQQSDKDPVPVFLIDSEPETHEKVLEIVARFTLAGDFRVTDLTSSTAMLSLQGKQARQLLSRVAELPTLADDEAATINWQGRDLQVVHATHTSEDGFDLILDGAAAAEFWEAILNEGARPTGFDALDILRIEAGISRHGLDIDETLVVSEANLDEAVSYTKGCYIGQEIIARIKYRGHVAKKVTGVVFEQATRLDAGATVRSADDKEIGKLTSLTYSPHLGRTVALGLLKYQFLTPGTVIRVGEAGLEAQVSELPFVKGSWFAA